MFEEKKRHAGAQVAKEDFERPSDENKRFLPMHME